MPIDIRGEVRKLQKVAQDTFRTLRLTAFESLAITNTEDRYTELARAGRRFNGYCLVTGSTAIPTTTARTVLYNMSTYRSLVIDYATFNFYGTSLTGGTFLGTVSPGPVVTALNTGDAVTSGSSSLSNCQPQGILNDNINMTMPSSPTAPAWVPLQSVLITSGASNSGMGDGWIKLGGRFIVPPKCLFGVALVSASGASGGVGLMWSELELDLE